jgi:predicted HTH transcriptional regulator
VNRGALGIAAATAVETVKLGSTVGKSPTAKPERPNTVRPHSSISQALDRFGPMTADQCANLLRIDKLSIRPRFSELAAQGKIIDTGERRPNQSGKRAIVWAVPSLARAA